MRWEGPVLYQWCSHPCCVDLAGSGFACHGKMKCGITGTELDDDGRIPEEAR